MGLSPRVLEGALATIGVLWIALRGPTDSVTQLATLLMKLSLGGLVVLLLAEARARRRWTVR